MATQKDAQYLEEARNLKLDISPISGDEVMRVVARIGSAPPETVDYMRKLFANKGSE